MARRIPIRWFLGTLLALAAGLPGARLPDGVRSARAAEPEGRVRRGWDYEVRPAADLRSAEVRICFRRFLPRRLVLGDPRARVALAFDDAAPERPTLALAPDGEGVLPVDLSGGGCVHYRVDLDALTGGRRRAAARVGGDLLLSPGLFLLRPAVWPSSVFVTCRFFCPGGLNVSVAWPRVRGARTPHTYVVPFSGQRLEGVLVLGRFAPETLQAAGATFQIARLDQPHKATEADVDAWLTAAARAVASLFGRYPQPRVQVVLLPVGPAREPVVFGRARRAGGASTIFYLSALADRASLVGEWVAVHEMIHLGMPWTAKGEDWFQEGFTTYYQEVLRTRAGFQDVEAGWQQIAEGFERGRRGSDDLTLAEASRDMHQTHAYWRVYWGGCAVALLCDMEIRRVFRGTRTLDDVMRYLNRTVAHGGRAYTGLALLEAADQWLGRPVCVPIARKLLGEPRLGPLTEANGKLGLLIEEGRVRLDPAGAALARAIMAPPPPVRPARPVPRNRR